MARVILAALLAAFMLASAAEPLPVEVMFKRPQFYGATISPSGKYVAAVGKTVKDRYNALVIDLQTRKASPITAIDDGDVTRVRWQSDDRLVVFVGDIQKGTGEPPRERGFVAVDRDGRNAVVLSRRYGVPESVYTFNGDEILLATANRPGKASLDVYRVNTRTQDEKLLTFESPGKVRHWAVDFDGIPRAAVTEDAEYDKTAWYVRDGIGQPWRKVEEGPRTLLDTYPGAFSPDGKVLYVHARRGQDRAALYEYEIGANRWTGPVFRHVERDVYGNYIFDLEERKLLGVAYRDDKPGTVWFDPEHVKMQRSVDAVLPTTVNRIEKGRDRWLVTTSSDRNPGEVYILDGRTMKMEKLLAYRPWINPNEMAPTRWVRYRARDGLTIPALLTIPKDSDGKKLPLVVAIRNSLFGYATEWNYQPQVQFLASRGYAVLQPQARGTRGFGWNFHSSGFRRIGEEMQDDIEDAAKWAIGEGLADPRRIAFYGSSYGGMAAILGTIKSPDLVKCAVVRSGIATVDWLFVTGRRLDATEARAEMIGTDRARLRRASPLENAEKIAAPVLLAYGSYDIDLHGVDLHRALQRYDKPHEWVEYDEHQGFGFALDKNIFDFYQRVERFLAQHLRQQ
ncbi:MAG TPA: prolyl oligopeptidase family serine peptidase [Burkholderiales bacterium]|jgi:dipeptidyl aminopeptidase/acylaminoacyl peptidase